MVGPKSVMLVVAVALLAVPFIPVSDLARATAFAPGRDARRTSLAAAVQATPAASASPTSGGTEAAGTCEVKILPNPALVDGAKRMLAYRRGTDPFATIGGNAFQFTNAAIASAVLDAIARQFADFDSALAAFLPNFPPAADLDVEVQVGPMIPPRIGDDAAAFAGTVDARAASGERTTSALAVLLYREGTTVVQLMAETTRLVTGPDRATPESATPVASDAVPLLDELTAVARIAEARSPGGAVVWSPTLGHCVGGLFEVLPGPDDVAGSHVVLEQRPRGRAEP